MPAVPYLFIRAFVTLLGVWLPLYLRRQLVLTSGDAPLRAHRSLVRLSVATALGWVLLAAWLTYVLTTP